MKAVYISASILALCLAAANLFLVPHTGVTYGVSGLMIALGGIAFYGAYADAVRKRRDAALLLTILLNDLVSGGFQAAAEADVKTLLNGIGVELVEKRNKLAEDEKKNCEANFRIANTAKRSRGVASKQRRNSAAFA